MSREWIPISERKPTRRDASNDGEVLQLLDDGQCVLWDLEYLDHVTHWMPIPPPPPKPKVWRTATAADVGKPCRVRDCDISDWRAELWLFVGFVTRTEDRKFVAENARGEPVKWRFCEVEADA